MPLSAVEARPFEGVRVVDLTHVLAGPFAAYQLGVLGADVIRVEHPHQVDLARQLGPDVVMNEQLLGTGYVTQGSNKRSLSLDLRTDVGRGVLRRLLGRADVLVENFRPGALDALELGYEQVRTINPSLIYVSLSLFGHTGDKRSYTGYDHNVQASSGMMAMTGTPAVHPLKCGPLVVDYATGMCAAFAVSAALFQRTRTQVGQRVDLAMMDVATALMASHVTAFSRSGTDPRPNGDRAPLATNDVYVTGDGLLMLGAGNAEQNRRLWAALDRPDLARDGLAEREAAYEQERDLLVTVLRTRTADEWEQFFQERHVPATRVRVLSEVLADPHTRSRGLLHQQHLPGVDGPVTVPVSTFRFEHGGPSIETPPPTVGQHNDAILSELGYSDDDIARIRGCGALG
jgi:crotonobetainyl-CoA:carnitine CoA-transferase CaiB-like acyl-CoA transferase